MTNQLKRYFVVAATFMLPLFAQAQDNVGVGTTTPDPSAILDLNATDKGILILKCRAPTSAHLEDLRRQEEIWDATKGNATYFEATKQARSKDLSLLAHDFGELWSNIATFCALLYTLFGEGCDLYKSMLKILQVLSHPFCMQNKQAYTPEVCCRIAWAIIVDTRSFLMTSNLQRISSSTGIIYSSQYLL